MIHLFAYYSVGGYKIMHAGELSPNSDAVYYLPLLPIMKKRKREEEKDEVERLDVLPKIGLVCETNYYGFPNECYPLFTHGAFVLMYRTLQNGCACLAIKNLGGSSMDEEGRSIPFSLLFVANETDDNHLLDNVAEYCRKNASKLSSELSPTIVYDVKVNGLRVNMNEVYGWMTSCPSSERQHNHCKKVDMLMVVDANGIDIALREQGFSNDDVNIVVDCHGEEIKRAAYLDAMGRDNVQEESPLDELIELGKEGLKKLSSLLKNSMQ